MPDVKLAPMMWEPAQWFEPLLYPKAGRGRAIDFVTTDSRKAANRGLFVALKGEIFDGADFLDQAYEAGTRAFIVNDCEKTRKAAEKYPDAAFLFAPDSTRAFGDLANAWRRSRSVKLFNITGSSGKTTTKEMCAHIARSFGAAHFTEGNFNNLIGVPITLLNIRDEPVSIVEIGTSAPGEIAREAEICEPDAGLITAVHAAHLEGLGSIEGVAKEKLELFSNLAQRGKTLAVNLDDEFVAKGAEALNAAKISYSISRRDADIRAENIAATDVSISFDAFYAGKRAKVEMPIAGLHNVSNALAALSFASIFGFPFSRAASALCGFEPYAGRQSVRSEFAGVTVIDDSYNANAGSMKASLSALKLRKGRKIAALGSIMELGNHSEAIHKEIGAFAADAADALFFFGPSARLFAEGAEKAGAKTAFVFEEDMDALVSALSDFAKPGDVALIKGSRRNKMERAIAAFEKFRTPKGD